MVEINNAAKQNPEIVKKLTALMNEFESKLWYFKKILLLSLLNR